MTPFAAARRIGHAEAWRQIVEALGEKRIDSLTLEDVPFAGLEDLEAVVIVMVRSEILPAQRTSYTLH
jgi:hypothetical protein